ncbi:helix-turn-helix transcriptional regulator [Emticicia sp. C21]|uniref:helix-turn-helix transcriptional regulator n=1 Tax=Emticicia sp. C21 TaxID=2302915 RepID=UPI000E3560E1|nr:AraC family transcriptional regulator [Emticicia sp. C21]RFS17773.1 AraC family transcriptional regulator [Emticicia sp. C21]
MEYVNAKRSFNAAKRSLILDTLNQHQDYCGHYPIIQQHSGDVQEYYLEIKGGSLAICKEIVLPGFWMQISNLCLPYQLCLHTRKQEDAFQMHFSLSAELSGYSQESQLDIRNGTGNFLFLPKHLSDYKKNGDLSNCINFEVNFSPEYFYRQFASFSDYYPEFFARVNRGEVALLNSIGMMMLPRMKQIVVDIIQCRLRGPFNKIYIEAKVHELLVLQMDQFSQQIQENHQLNQVDKAKFALVKDLLLSRRKTPSLHELSLESGLNLDKLKKGFKAIYGATIFGYLNDIKMEEARQQLLSMDATVSEIAEKAGYKNPQHFTAAFKRKYGVLPRDMRH